VATVGLAIAGDTSVDDVHGDWLAGACIHAWAVDAARVWKRIGGCVRAICDGVWNAGTTPSAESQARVDTVG